MTTLLHIITIITARMIAGKTTTVNMMDMSIIIITNAAHTRSRSPLRTTISASPRFSGHRFRRSAMMVRSLRRSRFLVRKNPR